MKSATEKIVNQILASLESGVVPWKMPWLAVASQNPFSGTIYKGINRLVLAREQREPYFLTFKQIKEHDGNLKKGSQGFHVCYKNRLYKDSNGKTITEKKYKQLNTIEQMAYKVIPYLKDYCVFSSADIENIDFPEPPHFEHEPVDMLENVLFNVRFFLKLDFGFDRGRAFYSPAGDYVRVPKLQYFESKEEYYSAIFHELGHWTMHEKRCNRKGALGGFGSKKYGREELVAELTSSIILHTFGMVPVILENSVSYITGWYNSIKADPQILIQAASDAEKAAAYILQYNNQ